MEEKRTQQDETLKMQDALTRRTEGVFQFMRQPLYNIDDMDDANFMRDHRMEGGFPLICMLEVDPAHPGTVFVDGQDAGAPIVTPNLWGGGTSLALKVRRFVREYDREYAIRYEGAVTKDGTALEPFEFALRSLPKPKIGEIYPEHDALVLQAAREGMVLLKNDNEALPLSGTVNTFGKAAATFRLGCVGAGKINPRYGIRFEEGIRSYSKLALNEELFEFYRSRESDELPPAELLEAARARSDTAVVLLTRGTGESMDNKPEPGEYYLTSEEKALLRAVSERFAKTVVVLNVGYPIEMGWVKECRIDAVL